MFLRHIVAVALVALSLHLQSARTQDADGFSNFECNSGQDIWANLTCDGVFHCFDRSDESRCERPRGTELKTNQLDSSDLDYWKILFALPALWLTYWASKLFYLYCMGYPRPDRYLPHLFNVVEAKCCLLTKHILNLGEAPWWKTFNRIRSSSGNDIEITAENYMDMRSNAHFSIALQNLIDCYHTQDCEQKKVIKNSCVAKWLAIGPIWLVGSIAIHLRNYIITPIVLVIYTCACFPCVLMVAGSNVALAPFKIFRTFPWFWYQGRILCCTVDVGRRFRLAKRVAVDSTAWKILMLHIAKCSGTCLTCINVSVQKSKEYYEKELHANSRNSFQADRFFFWVLGDSDLTGHFYDCYERSLMSDDAIIGYKGSLKTHIWVLMLKFHKWCCQSPASLLVISSRVLSVVSHILVLRVMAPLLHSWDWLKDVYIAYKIGNLILNGESESSNFALFLFIIIVLSLVVDALAMPMVLFLHPTDRPFMRWSPGSISMRPNHYHGLKLIRRRLCSWRNPGTTLGHRRTDFMEQHSEEVATLAGYQAARYASKNWSLHTFLRSAVLRFLNNVSGINTDLIKTNMIKEKAERWARREYEWVEEDNEMVERQLRSRRRRSCHVLQRDSVTSPQRGGNSSTTSSSDQISVATAQPIRRRRTSSDGDATSVLDFVAHDERTMIRTSESLMAKSREREHRLRSRLSYLKMTTNNVEDFVQLALLLVLISFWHTNTSSISTGVGASDVLFQVWGGDDSLIPHPEYVFASTSLLSLILGHMSLLSTNKNGFTTFIGHWFIALPYFIISTASRIFSVVLFFTPIIGLFDTLHLVQMGMIPASSDKWTGPNVGYTENPDGTFNGTWSKFSFADNSEFPGIPFWVGFTPAILMGIHILVGFVILYVVLGDYEGEWDDLPLLRSDVVAEENTEQDMEGNVPKEEQKEQTPRKYKYGRRALYSLWTMVCPPLFLDWEEILRHYTDSVIFDKKPWERELPKDLGKVYIDMIFNTISKDIKITSQHQMLMQWQINLFFSIIPQLRNAGGGKTRLLLHSSSSTS